LAKRSRARAGKAAGAGAIASSRLGELGSPEETAFRRAVYDEQLRRALATKEFFPGLAPDELGSIEGHPIHKVAAGDAASLLRAARADLAAAKERKDDPLAAACASVGIGNAYRDPERDFTAWQKAYATHFKRTEDARNEASGGPFGPAAVGILVRRMRSMKAVPGFSNHTLGLAIDFTTRQGKTTLGAKSAQAKAWRASWFHRWLVVNASRFDFRPLASEEWHWDHAGGKAGPTPDAASPVGPGPAGSG
jgi:hypothetical protein